MDPLADIKAHIDAAYQKDADRFTAAVEMMVAAPRQPESEPVYPMAMDFAALPPVDYTQLPGGLTSGVPVGAFWHEEGCLPMLVRGVFVRFYPYEKDGNQRPFVVMATGDPAFAPLYSSYVERVYPLAEAERMYEKAMANYGVEQEYVSHIHSLCDSLAARSVRVKPRLQYIDGTPNITLTMSLVDAVDLLDTSVRNLR